jgi:very-short-patch-repair endonuclease
LRWFPRPIHVTTASSSTAAAAPIRLPGHTVYLDLYAPAEKVNIELDGGATHSSPADRERDRRRDAALAALGILVVRYTHHRLTHDPDGVRREVLAILAARRGTL